jgi:hypothetical protein
MKSGERRRYWVLPLAVLMLALLAATALAVKTNKNPIVVEVGNLKLTFDGGFSPEALPKSKPTPISFYLSGKFQTKDGTHPPALREFYLEGDKNVTIDVKGIPVCPAAKLQSTDTKHAEAACPKSIIGRGKTKVEIEFPEQPPIYATSDLILFNSGFKGGVTTLLVHAYITVPTPAAVVTTVKIKKVKKGRYGLSSIATIPKIAGGSGSPLFFKLTVFKGILSGKCPDGRLQARGRAVFSDGTSVGAEVARPCTPKG